MNDELQQSIGILLKAIAFYIAVLAVKNLIPAVDYFYGESHGEVRPVHSTVHSEKASRHSYSG